REHPGCAGGVADGAGLIGRDADGLLHEDVLTGIDGGQGESEVLAVGSGDVDDLHLRIGVEVRVVAVAARDAVLTGERGGALARARCRGDHGLIGVRVQGVHEVGGDASRRDHAPAQHGSALERLRTRGGQGARGGEGHGHEPTARARARLRGLRTFGPGTPERPALQEGGAFRRRCVYFAATTCSVMTAVTSSCRRTVASCSPTDLIGAAKCTLRLSIEPRPASLTASATSAVFTEPNRRPSPPALTARRTLAAS